VHADNVLTTSTCYVNVRRQYLHALPTHGFHTRSPVVSACKCDAREFIRPLLGVCQCVHHALKVHSTCLLGNVRLSYVRFLDS